MNEQVSKQCYQTADKIINILDQLGFSTEVKPAYDGLLRDLITIEVRRNINAVVMSFYNNVAMTPIDPVEQTDGEIMKSLNGEGKCCGGNCSCDEETDTQN